MTDRPSPSEQRKQIKAIEFDPLVIGADAYVIAKDWLINWREYVGSDDDDEIDASGTCPEMNNQGIIDNKGNLSGKCRSGTDYEVVTPAMHKLFESWYGGGPTLKVPVVGNENDEPVAVLQYIDLHVHFGAKVQKVKVHKYTKIEEIAKMVTEKSDSRLRDKRVYDYEGKEMGMLLGMDDTVGACELMDGQDVLVDVKDAYGRWIHGVKATRPVVAQERPTIVNRTQLNGKCGLQNLGNTCFFNSGTQCLLHTRVLVSYMLGNEWVSNLNRTNPLGMKGILAETFGRTCSEFWEKPGSYVTPRDLKHVIGRFAPQFSGWNQQDSHELITFMLDGIHEDLNQGERGPVPEIADGNGENDEEVSRQAWERYRGRNNSVVVDYMHGQYRSQLSCPECHKVTVVFDPYMSLQVPVIRRHTMKLSVIFVPFGFSDKTSHITLEVPSSLDVKDSAMIGKAVSDKLGREVNVIIGTRYSTNSTVSWDVRSWESCTCYAFEIPDKTKRYIYGCVKMQKAKETWAKEVTSPFLVEVPSLEVSDEELEALVVEKLQQADVWNVESGEPESVFKNSSTTKFAEQQKLLITKTAPYAYSYYGKPASQGMSVSTVHPFMVTTTLYVTLNSDIPFSDAKLMANFEEIGTGYGYSSSAASDDTVYLSDCFKYYSEPETLDEANKWFCPHCRQFVCATKKLDIWKVPEVLVLHLKRFTAGRYGASKKIDSLIDFPDELDMRPYVVGPQRSGNLKYRLYAVSNHMGGLGGGHYTAHAIVQNPFEPLDPNGTWYSFNDGSASPCSASSAHSRSAYVLFYERIPDTDDADID